MKWSIYIGVMKRHMNDKYEKMQDEDESNFSATRAQSIYKRANYRYNRAHCLANRANLAYNRAHPVTISSFYLKKQK